MVRILLTVLGVFLLLLGVVGILTPIPFGVVFLLLAMVILIPVSPLATTMIRGLRRRSRRFDSLMVNASSRAPVPYRRILRSTEVRDLERSPYHL